MAAEEELQRNVLGIIGSAVKASPASGKVDANQLMFEMSTNWGQLRKPDGLDLQPLYASLMARSVPPNDAAMVCLLIHKREDRVGLKVKLPPMVATLPEKVRTELLSAASRMGGTGLTNAGGPAAAAPPPRSATNLPPVGGQARQTTQVVPFTAPTGGLMDRLGATLKSSRISPATIVIIVVACIVAGAANYAMREKGPEPMKVSLPAGLPALTAFRDGPNIYLFDAEKDFNRPVPELAAMGKPLLDTFTPLGAERVWLCRNVDQRCLKSAVVFRQSGPMWVDKKLRDEALKTGAH